MHAISFSASCPQAERLLNSSWPLSDPNLRFRTQGATSATVRGSLEPRLVPSSTPQLLNSVVRDWPWPCILVFVTQWQTLDDLHSKPDEVIPPFVYMPDGRMVPMCLVLAESSNATCLRAWWLLLP
jgi:hypothetical protein